MKENNDLVKAYSKGRSEGEQAVLRLIKIVLDNADQAGWGLSAYYTSSLNLIMELYGYGTEKETKKECTQQET